MTERTVACIVCKDDVATSGEGDSTLISSYWTVSAMIHISTTR